MKNNEYNSLTEKLIKSGIIQKNSEEITDSDINFFNVKNSDETEAALQSTKTNKNRKRINSYDLELINKTKIGESQDQENSIEKLFYKLFPKLYEFKIAKNALKKLDELGIDANILLNKTVPYGESEIRYKNLVKFIKYANEIQTKIKRN